MILAVWNFSEIIELLFGLILLIVKRKLRACNCSEARFSLGYKRCQPVGVHFWGLKGDVNGKNGQI